MQKNSRASTVVRPKDPWFVAMTVTSTSVEMLSLKTEMKRIQYENSHYQNAFKKLSSPLATIKENDNTQQQRLARKRRGGSVNGLEARTEIHCTQRPFQLMKLNAKKTSTGRETYTNTRIAILVGPFQSEEAAKVFEGIWNHRSRGVAPRSSLVMALTEFFNLPMYIVDMGLVFGHLPVHENPTCSLDQCISSGSLARYRRPIGTTNRGNTNGGPIVAAEETMDDEVFSTPLADNEEEEDFAVVPSAELGAEEEDMIS